MHRSTADRCVAGFSVIIYHDGEAGYVCDVYSGGTQVTVFGKHLNSVAEPRITVTVIITRVINDTHSTYDKNETDSEVA